MPKAFSADARETIKKDILRKGKELFTQYGLRRTNVADIAVACDIAKGSFYSFFDSKEDLFVEIVLSHQADIKVRLMQRLQNEEGSPIDVMHNVFSQQLADLEHEPILQILLDKEEYAHLIRNLKPQRLVEFQTEDQSSNVTLIEFWQEQGIVRSDINAQVIAGMLKAIFLLTLHRDEVGRAHFLDICQTFFQLIAAYILEPTSP